jgi:nitroreductase
MPLLGGESLNDNARMKSDMVNLPKRIQNILQGATLAPSSHNTQPWLFEVGDSSIRLYADRTRALPVNDPDDRELLISCGCALLNLRVAAAHEALATEVSLPTEPDDEDLLAEVRLIEGKTPDQSDLALFPSIQKRRTCRKKFADRDVDEATVEELSAAVAKEGADLQIVRDPSNRKEVAALVAEGDATQWSDPSWRRELAAWMHPRRRGDGLVLPGIVAPVARTVVRTFDMGRRIAANDAQLAIESQVIAVISTQHDHPNARLRAGQALERFLLSACAAGLQASYLNQPIQVSTLRPKLQNLLKLAGYPQVLLRIGYPIDEVPPPTPRRDLNVVLCC